MTRIMAALSIGRSQHQLESQYFWVAGKTGVTAISPWLLSFPHLSHRQKVRRQVDACHVRRREVVRQPPRPDARRAAHVQHVGGLPAPVLVPELLPPRRRRQCQLS